MSLYADHINTLTAAAELVSAVTALVDELDEQFVRNHADEMRRLRNAAALLGQAAEGQT